MAEGIVHEIGTPAIRPKMIAGTFYPNGNSTTPMTVAAGTLKGKGITSVTRTGTAGTYTVVLDDTYYKLIAHNVSVQHTTAVDLKAQLGDISNVGTSTVVSFVVRVLAVATPTDITANANSSVSFWVLFEDSSGSR